MRDCPSSRIFAACRDFISVTTDVPFRWDERWAWFRCAFIIPLEDEHVHALRSGERGCFLVVQTLWAEKIQSTTDAESLNTFDRNEIEVAPISSALLRIACLVILYKTCHSEPTHVAGTLFSFVLPLSGSGQNFFTLTTAGGR